MVKFKNKLVGSRITLKRTKPDLKLAKIMFETIDENREHIAPWLPWEELTNTVQDSLDYLVEKEKETEVGKKIEYGVYVEDSYAGNIGIFDINKKHKSVEIGYWLSKNFTGNGYITEAIKVVEKEFFENLDTNRIQIKCDENNIASIEVAKRCGYTFEGKIREEKYSEFLEGFRNTLVFSKLKSDYF